MATILTKPGNLALSGNIADIVISTSTSIPFTITEVGGDVILQETYSPDSNNRVVIRLRDILPSQLSLSLPTSDVFTQTNAVKVFTFNVDENYFTTIVVLAGVDADIDPLTFLNSNWLTWQPQQKSVKYNDPEYLTYYAYFSATVKVKAYFKDKDPEIITLTSIPSGKCYSLNMNFGYLSGKFEGQPVYFDVWNEDTTGNQLAFIQRFVLIAEYHEFDDIFVFVNSLGGLDTMRFTGEKEETNKFDIESALFDEDTFDYDIDFERSYKKNTGYFSDDRHKIWAQEFFNSLKRYITGDKGYQSITISKPKAKSVQGDISSYNYDFEFALSRQTHYLNLSRANELPTEVVIVDPDSELFFLAPRLNEFPSATLNSALTFLVQVPFTEIWQQVTYGAIRSNILGEVAAMGFVSGENIGEIVDLSAYAKIVDLHEHSNKALLDGIAVDGNYLTVDDQEVWVANTDRLGNVPAADYWTKNELINDSLYLKVGADKIKAGYADLAFDAENLGGIAAADYWNRYNSNIPTVDWEMQNAIFNGELTTAAFAQGIIGGVGAKIWQDGSAEMKSLDLREFLRTPELIKNQVRVAGNQFWFTDPGLIQSVTGTGPYTLTLKIEEGDGVSFEIDDILIGIFNHDTGFETCYLDVISVDLQDMQVVVNSRNGIAPRPFMQLARKGNETNAKRQTSVFVDGLNGFVRVLGDVDDHVTGFNNIIAQLGYLNLTSPVFGLMEKGLYVKNNGYFENVRVSGDIIVTGGNAETLDGAQAKANTAEGNATGVANTAQGRADSAYAVAESKTNAWVTQITHDTVTAEYMRTLNLVVGDQIQMGANAVISWDKVTGTQGVETTAGAQAKADAAENSAKSYSQDAVLGVYNGYFEMGNRYWSPYFSGKEIDQTSKGAAKKVDGKYVLECNGSTTLYSMGYFPVDVNKRYRMKFRVRQTINSTSGGSTVYAGVATLDENFNNITGGEGTHRYFCTGGGYSLNTSHGWKEFEGIIEGIGDNRYNFREGTVYVRTMFIVNYVNGNGTAQVDHITFEDITQEVNATAVANTAQGRADSAYAVAASKTDAWATQITKDTVTAEYMRTLNLTVGDQISMGANAVISWNKVTDKTIVTDGISTAQSAADNANNLASTANTNAGNAQLTANTAVSDAATAQNSADTANALAESKTNAWVTQITQDTVTAEFMRTLNLTVGDQISMGANAVISWDQVIGGQGAIDAVQVGGRNYIKNSSLGAAGSNIYLGSKSSFVVKDGISCMYLNQQGYYNAGNGYAFIDILPVIGGETYTISIDVKTDLLQTILLDLDGAINKTIAGVQNGDWTRHTSTYTASYSGTIRVAIYAVYGETFTGWLKNLKLEKGNKATDWTPAPEDIDASIATKITGAEATVITNDTIATTNVVAQNLQVQAANIAGQLTAAQINFDNAVGANVTLIGHIEAETGLIGSFNVTPEHLRGGSTIGGGFTGVELNANPDDEGYIRMYRDASYLDSKVGMTFGTEVNPTESSIFSSAAYGEYVLGLNLVSQENIALLSDADVYLAGYIVKALLRDSNGYMQDLFNIKLTDNSHGALAIGTTRRTEVKINGMLQQDGYTSPNWSTNSASPTQLIANDSYNSYYEDADSGLAKYVYLPSPYTLRTGTRIKIGTGGRSIYIVANATSKLRWDSFTKRTSGSYSISDQNQWTEWINHGSCWTLCHSQNL